MHVAIELAWHALHELVYACQRVGCRQMHNYIYSAHTIGEMLMIGCSQ